MKTFLFIVLALASFPSIDAHAFGKKPASPAPAPAPQPSPPPNNPSDKGCPSPGAVQAVDLSMPVDQKFLDAMKTLKVNTVIRYYDHTNETLPGKTLRAAEVDLLARNGFDLMVVFQHNNNSIASFTPARGTSDANRSLQLAAQFRQTQGSAIYFGVDGSWSSSTDLAKVKTYFENASPLVRGGGFKVGAYGSGFICTELLKSGLVDYCWLANAKGWPGYSSFYATNKWTMVQKVPQDCGGKNVDFNVVNPQIPDLGQFRP
ncbi:MAG TPA: glycoside hydrolase domain-containing protein [Bdellovibrionota bacterium]|jgi:hypothetical protein